MFPPSIAPPMCRHYGSKEIHNYLKIEMTAYLLALTSQILHGLWLESIETNGQRVKVEFLVGAVQNEPKGKISASSYSGAFTIIKILKWGGHKTSGDDKEEISKVGNF